MTPSPLASKKANEGDGMQGTRRFTSCIVSDEFRPVYELWGYRSNAMVIIITLILTLACHLSLVLRGCLIMTRISWSLPSTHDLLDLSMSGSTSSSEDMTDEMPYDMVLIFNFCAILVTAIFCRKKVCRKKKLGQ